MRYSLRTIVFGAAMLALAGPAFAQDADWAKVEAAAKKEGTVSFYTSFLGNPKMLAIIDKFQSETGIKVALLDVRASEMEMRARADKAANKIVADVFLNGLDALVADEKDGLIGKIEPVPNVARLKPEVTKFVSPLGIPSHFLPYAILINTDMVKGADVPTSWWDLADPKWKGKIQSDDPRAAGGGIVWFSASLHALGRDYQEKMGKQGLTISRNVADDEQRVARGEFPIRIPQIFGNWLNHLQGLPVKLVVPKEGAAYIQFLMAISNAPTHPNAARYFINWWIGEEAQVALANQAMITAGALDPAKVDPAARVLAESKLMGTTDPEHRAEELKLAAEIYK